MSGSASKMGQVRQFILQSERFWEAVLSYAGLNVQYLHAQLKASNIKCSVKELENILDALSIVRNRNTVGNNGNPMLSLQHELSGREGQPSFVYVLVESSLSINDKIASVYVGSSNNPDRRLKQHNQEISGGARKTKKTKWRHVIVVGGFRNKKTALQFEWSVQHGNKSVFLSSSNLPKPKTVRDHLKNVLLLISLPPFQRMGLTVKFVDGQSVVVWDKLAAETSLETICSSELSTRPLPFGGWAGQTWQSYLEWKCDKACNICKTEIKGVGMVTKCDCASWAHSTCLAKHALGNDDTEVLPFTFCCPNCKLEKYWSRLSSCQVGGGSGMDEGGGSGSGMDEGGGSGMDEGGGGGTDERRVRRRLDGDRDGAGEVVVIESESESENESGGVGVQHAGLSLAAPNDDDDDDDDDIIILSEKFGGDEDVELRSDVDQGELEGWGVPENGPADLDLLRGCVAEVLSDIHHPIPNRPKPAIFALSREDMTNCIQVLEKHGVVVQGTHSDVVFFCLELGFVAPDGYSAKTEEEWKMHLISSGHLCS